MKMLFRALELVSHFKQTPEAVNAENRDKGQWLLLMRPQGIMEVRTILVLLPAVLLPTIFSQLCIDLDPPKLAHFFSTDRLSTLLNVLANSHDPAAPYLKIGHETPDLNIEQHLLAPIGESSP